MKEEPTMKKRIVIGVVATLVGISAVAAIVQRQSQPSPAVAMAQTSQEKLTGVAATALQQAMSEKKFLFLFVYGKDDEHRAQRKDFEAVMAKIDARWVAVNRDAPSEQAFAQKYRLLGTPTPLIIAIAPNGALTGGFKEISEARCRKSMVSPGFQTCLKALQDQKLVLLCLQNQRTKHNEEAMRGVNEFKADAGYGALTEIVRVDPADPSEKSFLDRIRVSETIQEATTILLSPPGSVLASFTGATSKKDFTDAIQRAVSSSSGSYNPRR